MLGPKSRLELPGALDRLSIQELPGALGCLELPGALSKPHLPELPGVLGRLFQMQPQNLRAIEPKRVPLGCVATVRNAAPFGKRVRSHVVLVLRRLAAGGTSYPQKYHGLGGRPGASSPAAISYPGPRKILA